MKGHSSLLPPPPYSPMVLEPNHQRVSSLQVFFIHFGGFRGDSVVKNLPVNVGDTRVMGRGGYPQQYSCLENSVDRGPWRAAVPGVTTSRAVYWAHALCSHRDRHVWGLFGGLLWLILKVLILSIQSLVKLITLLLEPKISEISSLTRLNFYVSPERFTQLAVMFILASTKFLQHGQQSKKYTCISRFPTVST